VAAATVRRATAADIARLEPLWVGMVEHHRAVAGAVWPVREAAMAWAIRREQYAGWLADGSGTLFVAEEDGGEALGYALLRVDEPGATWDLGERMGEIESLAVSERARGAGVGTALIDACRTELLQRGIEYWMVAVVEANSGAVRLYERAGFSGFYRSMLGRVDAGGG
jgi:ribosomal protein S18 acetylase RimI-like enzyme